MTRRRSSERVLPVRSPRGVRAEAARAKRTRMRTRARMRAQARERERVEAREGEEAAGAQRRSRAPVEPARAVVPAMPGKVPRMRALAKPVRAVRARANPTTVARLTPIACFAPARSPTSFRAAAGAQR